MYCTLLFPALTRKHASCPLTLTHTHTYAHNAGEGTILTNANLTASHYQLLMYSGTLLAANTNARALLMLNANAVTVRVLSQPAHPGLCGAL